MAEIKVLKLASDGVATEHNDTADSPQFPTLGLGATPPTGTGVLEIDDASGQSAYIEVDNGGSAAASQSGKGRIRYDHTNNKFDVSENAGSYRRLVQSDSFDFRLNGKPAVQTGVDGAWIAPKAGIIVRVTLWRRTAGGSGTTTVDVHKGGTTIYTTQANRPAVTSGAGANALSTTTPDVTTFAQNDRFEMDIDTVEAGNPQDVAVRLEVQYT